MSEEQTPFGIVYAIIGPADYIRYVGKHVYHEKHGSYQESLETYLNNTIKNANKNNNKRALHVQIREWTKRKIKPKIVYLEKCFSLFELNNREIFLIAFFRKRLPDLLNRAPGGAGGWDPRLGKKNGMYGKSLKDHMSEEDFNLWRKHISESNKIAQNKPERKEQARNNMLGRVFSKEWRENISKSNIGRKHSEETKRKLSITHTGLQIGEKNGMFNKRGENNPNFKSKRTTEQRQNMSNGQNKPEVREAKSIKMRGENNPFFGKHHTDESKQKISNKRKGKMTWCKLTKSEKNDIINKWLSGNYSRKMLHEEYNKVTKALINWIIREIPGQNKITKNGRKRKSPVSQPKN
jgi:hypothetical protein